jgi:hypothetical protein
MYGQIENSSGRGYWLTAERWLVEPDKFCWALTNMQLNKGKDFAIKYQTL